MAKKILAAHVFSLDQKSIHNIFPQLEIEHAKFERPLSLSLRGHAEKAADIRNRHNVV